MHSAKPTCSILSGDGSMPGIMLDGAYAICSTWNFISTAARGGIVNARFDLKR